MRKRVPLRDDQFKFPSISISSGMITKQMVSLDELKSMFVCINRGVMHIIIAVAVHKHEKLGQKN